MKTALKSATASPRMAGVTLIELMIALVLGLLVSAAALGVFISNRETFRSTENMSRIQENARVAFELMSRDIREAGGTPCGGNLPATNLLPGWLSASPDPGTPAGTASPGINGTGTQVEVLSASGAQMRVNPPAAIPLATTQFTIDPGYVTELGTLTVGSLVIVCPFKFVINPDLFLNANRTASIRQVAAVDVPGRRLTINAAIDNPSSDPATPPATTLVSPITIAPVRAVRWTLNGTVLTRTDNILGAQAIADGVQSLQILYLTTTPVGAAVTNADNYVAPGDPSFKGWANVKAVRITLTLNSPANNGQVLERDFQHTIALRNRN